MPEVTIAGKEYRLTELGALDQLDLSMDISPLIPVLLPMFAHMDGIDKNNLMAHLETLAAALTPVAQAFSGLTRERRSEITVMCLKGCMVKSGENVWANILKGSRQIMFDFIGPDAVVELIVATVKSNLGPFLPGILARLPSLPAAADSQTASS